MWQLSCPGAQGVSAFYKLPHSEHFHTRIHFEIADNKGRQLFVPAFFINTRTATRPVSWYFGNCWMQLGSRVAIWIVQSANATDRGSATEEHLWPC